MLVKDKIFITGITGTLGRAFVDLLKKDYVVSGVDHNENNVAKFIRDYPGIDVKIAEFHEVDLKGQDILIHLAAMKHIDLCEKNANSCVLNNVIKSYLLFEEAVDLDIDILFMSTDKAVEPTSNYGFAKALCEAMVLEHGGAFARSGNIMSSNGSVMGIWDEALSKGEPIKITHEAMRRYFIAAENLAARIWEQYKKGVTTIIPEMDMNVNLVDLATEKIILAGENPVTYPMEFIGLRPGEKLEEALTWDKEQ